MKIKKLKFKNIKNIGLINQNKKNKKELSDGQWVRSKQSENIEYTIISLECS